MKSGLPKLNELFKDMITLNSKVIFHSKMERPKKDHKIGSCDPQVF